MRRHIQVQKKRKKKEKLNCLHQGQYVADLPGRRPLRSAGTNRLAEPPPVKLTTVANQPGFPGCRPTDMERSAERRDICRVVVHLPAATLNSPVHEILFLTIPWTELHVTYL